MIRILIAGDSPTTRLRLKAVFALDPDLSVVGAAANGTEAVDKFMKLGPDVVVLDPDMPAMNGLTALLAIRQRDPRALVIRCAAAADDRASTILTATARDAPRWDAGVTREHLISAIKTCFDAKHRASARPPGVSPAPLASPSLPPRPFGVRVVVIAASTGGTEAIRTVLSGLPADFQTPVLVVQHLPADLVREFANRLDRCCAYQVRMAEHGAPIEPGRVWVAPGDHHMECARRGPLVNLRLHQGPPERGNRPAADALFRSAARVYGRCTLGVVLTGMGADGLDGCRQIHRAGGRILVQDGASSVVWGMPGAVAQAGIADAVLTLGAVASAIAVRASA